MSFVRRKRFSWQLRSRALPLGEHTVVMGIVNATPDSFSDGGRYFCPEDAVAHAVRLLDEGAEVIDVGGESTRPGSLAGTAEAVGAEEEIRRVVPVIEGILRVRPDTVISVDTYRAVTARAAVMAGAEIVNDVSGMLWDGAMAKTCAELQCGVAVMHTRGLPLDWKSQETLRADEIVPLLRKDLEDRWKKASAAGIRRECVVLDPGFGFGKRGAENWALLARFSELCEMGFPLLAGLSRKGFLDSSRILPGTGAVTPRLATERDAETHAAGVAAVLGGAHLLRVHDVRGARDAAQAADAVLATL